MPNRILKESICTSASIETLTWFEECFFYRLIVNCDDYGRFDARPAVLKSRLFPLKERITIKDVSNALSKLAGIGIVRMYECDNKPYLYLPTWEVHQTIRAKRSRYPDPAGCTHDINCEQMNAYDCKCSRNPIQSESKEEKVNQKEKAVFQPPTQHQVEEYCQENGLTVDCAYFVDHYNANGWKVGRSGMKDWKATVRNWARREKKAQKEENRTFDNVI